MNLSQNFLLDQYIESPQTWLHKLNSNNKVYFLFIYLSIISYTYFRYVAFSTFLHLIPFFHLKNLQNDYQQFIFHTLYILFILSFTFCFVIKLIFKTYVIQFSCVYYTVMNTIFICSKYIFYIRMLTILIHYFFTINIVFMTTTYEDIIFSFFQLFRFCERRMIKRIIFISTFASQALENTAIKIQSILIAMKMKKFTKSLKFQYYILIYLISKFLKDIYCDIYRISTVLYTRELNHKILYIDYIYQ
uniref:Transmembrane protein n=1 Tax=Gracilaria vermiculophylla TaxID=2608709 RepID=A0A345U8Y1_9FLOR|nr:hypothetical protein [Gracilaria vermiculophylla]AXI96917.1 hypothetical protein [Gracilaria vermiculophylla]